MNFQSTKLSIWENRHQPENLFFLHSNQQANKIITKPLTET